MGSPDQQPGKSAAEQTLALFFTFRYALADWDEGGTIAREIALYNELGKSFDNIYVFTYGSNDETAYSKQFRDNVIVVDKPTGIPDSIYSFLAPVIHWWTLRDVDIVKTNQMLGSWTALIAATMFGASLVVRTGYVYSNFVRSRGENCKVGWKRVFAYVLEFIVYSASDGIITSSPHGREYIEKRYRPAAPHLVIPNYVETDTFCPQGHDKIPSSICFVGRFVEQKNLSSLIRALGGSKYSLTLVGDGPREEKLSDLAEESGADVTFRGRVSNHRLPEILDRHELFVLPSHYEGMPKALLEAMSCRMATVGTAVRGTDDVITHRHDGYLCETDPDSLREAIDTVMENRSLRRKLARNARETILTEYSLQQTIQQELELYELFV